MPERSIRAPMRVPISGIYQIKGVGDDLDVLDKMCRVPERLVRAPMRMPISGIYKIKGVGDVENIAYKLQDDEADGPYCRRRPPQSSQVG